MKTQDILKKMNTNAIVLNSIPMGYTPGLPMISNRGGKACLIIPYLKYKMTGKVDETLVYPPRYVLTVTASDALIVCFTDLAYDNRFTEVNFNHPVGTFRHSSIRHLNKKEYQQHLEALYTVIDCLIGSIEGLADFDDMDSMKIKRLFSMLLEPSVKPFYNVIEKDFFESYIKN